MATEQRGKLLGGAVVVALILAGGGVAYRLYSKGVFTDSDTARAAEEGDKERGKLLSDEERAKGWKLLFDGKSTDGWRKYKGKGVPEKWKVVEGALVFDPRASGGGGDIVTVEQFDNFELSLEWRISPRGNSGVMYRVTEEADAPYGSGPEYQILDNIGHADGRNPKTSAASCYALYAPSEDATKPVGEWNQTRLVCNGPHVEHWLNGKKVVTYEIGSEDWNKRVAESKFKDMPRFAKAAKGHIDLQDHGNEVAYRNIKIRPLPEKKDNDKKDK
jgi:hypothetical protein